jgi:hypothetical protein
MAPSRHCRRIAPAVAELDLAHMQWRDALVDSPDLVDQPTDAGAADCAGA